MKRGRFLAICLLAGLVATLSARSTAVSAGQAAIPEADLVSEPCRGSQAPISSS
jgi:hypothetical protein